MSDNLKNIETKTDSFLTKLVASPFAAAVVFVALIGLLLWMVFK